MRKKNTDPVLENRLSHIGEVIVAYHKQISTFKPTKGDYIMWIDSLREPMKTACEKKGFNHCLGHMNFVRFFLEFRDIGMFDYLKTHLSDDDFNFWKNDEMVNKV